MVRCLNILDKYSISSFLSDIYSSVIAPVKTGYQMNIFIYLHIKYVVGTH